MAVRAVWKRFCQDQLEVRIRSFCAMRDVCALTPMSSLALIVGGVTEDVFGGVFEGIFGHVFGGFFGGIFGGPSEPLLMTKPLGQPLAGHQSQAHLSSYNQPMTFFCLFLDRNCGFQWNSHLLPNLDTSGDLLHWIYKESLHTAGLLSVPMKYCQRHTGLRAVIFI